MDLMIDIETLGVSNNAAIISIGAVLFDPYGDTCGEEFYRNITFDSALDYGDYDPSTLKFWNQLPQPAKTQLFNPEQVHLKNALMDFHRFILDNKISKVWGNSPSFDMVILRNAYKNAKIMPSYQAFTILEFPVRFWLEMDVRTIKSVLPSDLIPSRTGTHHSALDDAKYQVSLVQSFFNNVSFTPVKEESEAQGVIDKDTPFQKFVQEDNAIEDIVKDIKSSIELIFSSVVIEENSGIPDDDTRKAFSEALEMIFQDGISTFDALTHEIVCDEINNPPDIVDSQKMVVDLIFQLKDSPFTDYIRATCHADGIDVLHDRQVS